MPDQSSLQPSNPLDLASKYQKSFFPFAAFSADDPNVTALPVLTLVSPWMFQAPGNVIAPLAAAPSGNVSYLTIPNRQGTYQIYIPSTYLVAASGGPFTLTLGTGSGTTIIVPIAKNGDTLLSGALLFNIYVDASGNVTGDAFEISGSNANGSWIKFGDGTMIEWNSLGLVTCTSAAGALWSQGPNAISFPIPFVAPPTVMMGMVQTNGLCFAAVAGAVTINGFNNYNLAVANGNQGAPQWLAIGRWK